MNTIGITGNNRKSDWFEYLYFFMIVIYAGMASPFTENMIYYTDQPVGFIIPVFMTIILLIKKSGLFLRYLISFNNYGYYSMATFTVH
jgi:hypothetical protein